MLYCCNFRNDGKWSNFFHKKGYRWPWITWNNMQGINSYLWSVGLENYAFLKVLFSPCNLCKLWCRFYYKYIHYIVKLFLVYNETVKVEGSLTVVNNYKNILILCSSVPTNVFFFFGYIYWLCYYSCPISAPSLNSILPTPSLPHSPPIVHVHGSYL